MKLQPLQVAIVGGGSAGLWLAHHLANEKVSCGVLDTAPFAGYASTKNQGWLQSGAYYAARGDIDAASACAQGFNFIRAFAPSQIYDTIPGYLLFENEEQLDGTIERCRNSDIWMEPIRFSALEESARILTTSPINQKLNYAARVRDCPVNSSGIMATIAHQAAQNGVRFISVPSLK